MEELRHGPIRFWRLDDDTPFADYSGFSGTFTRAGAEVKGQALTAPALYSQTFDSTHSGAFTVPAWRLAGREEASSSISFSIYLDDPAGTLTMSNDDESWVFTGHTLTYTLGLSTGDLEIFHDYTFNRRLNIVLNYSISGVELFVNGEKVETADIEDAMRPFTLLSTSSSWTIVCSAGTSATMNNLAFYQKSLSGDAVKAIHEYNERHAIEEVPRAFGGHTIRVSADVRKPSYEVRWDSDAEWNSGYHQNTIADNDQLQAQRENDLTLDGKWSNSITFFAPTPVPVLDSAYITWSGENAEVEVSFDGTTWVAPEYGENISLFPTGFDPNNKTLLVRVIFVAGEEEAYLDEFVFRAFTGTDAANHQDDRNITYTNPASAWEEYEPNELHNFWGARLHGAGKLTIAGDANMTVKTVELWMKLDTPSNITLSTNLSTPTNYYINGTVSGTLLYHQWVLVHYTYTAGFTDAFWISGDVTVGRIAVYPNVLTQAEITKINQAYTGFPKNTVDGLATIAITEPGASTKIYDHDWANLSSPT